MEKRGFSLPLGKMQALVRGYKGRRAAHIRSSGTQIDAYFCSDWNDSFIKAIEIREWLDTLDYPRSELPAFLYDTDEEPEEREAPINGKRESSYQTIMEALLRKLGYWPPDANTAGQLTRIIEGEGLTLSERTVRDILKSMKQGRGL